MTLPFVQSLLRDRFTPAADYRLRAQRHRAVCPGKLAGGH